MRGARGQRWAARRRAGPHARLGGCASPSSSPASASLAFSQLTATVLTLPRFLFTPQEARELLPPLPPQEVTAGRVSHAGACCPGPATGLRIARPSEAEPRTGGSPGRVVSLFQKDGPSAKTRGCECGRGRSSGGRDGRTGPGAVRSPGCGSVGCCLGRGPPVCRGDAAAGVQAGHVVSRRAPSGGGPEKRATDHGGGCSEGDSRWHGAVSASETAGQGAGSARGPA